MDHSNTPRPNGPSSRRFAIGWSNGILARVADAHVNAAGSLRAPNITNIRFDGIDSEALLIALDLRGFAVSTGSACSSGAQEPSHVLIAIGLTREQAKSSIRFSLGRSNDVAQVDALIDAVAEMRRPSQKAGARLCLSRPLQSRCRAESIAPSSRECCARAASNVVGLTMQLWNQRRLPELVPEGGSTGPMLFAR